MANLILQFHQAQKADDIAYNKWLKNKRREKLEWDALSEDMKKIRTSIGTAYSTTKPPMRKATRHFRRQIRNRIFRLRNGAWETDKELKALKSWFELQFRPQWTWKKFTFDWDISAVEPLKAISPLEWDGDVLKESLHGNIYDLCDPTAFTRQEM